MKSNELKHEIGAKFHIKSSVTGESVIGEVVEVEKHYLMDFVDFKGGQSRGWFNEKHLTPVISADNSLAESFIAKLREAKLLAPKVGSFSDEMRRAIRDSVEIFRRLDDLNKAGAKA